MRVSTERRYPKCRECIGEVIADIPDDYYVLWLVTDHFKRTSDPHPTDEKRSWLAVCLSNGRTKWIDGDEEVMRAPSARVVWSGSPERT